MTTTPKCLAELPLHYVDDYREFSEILVPTHPRVFLRLPDGTPASEPLIVSLDLSEVEFLS